jgi:hypothetical protein
MSTLGGEESLLEYDLFAVLSKARDDGFSGEAAHRAFEAAYARAYAEIYAAKRGRKTKDDNPHLNQMRRIITQTGASHWAAAMKVARIISRESNAKPRSTALRLRKQYESWQRTQAIKLVFDSIPPAVKEDSDDLAAVYARIERLPDSPDKAAMLAECASLETRVTQSLLRYLDGALNAALDAVDHPSQSQSGQKLHGHIF